MNNVTLVDPKMNASSKASRMLMKHYQRELSAGSPDVFLVHDSLNIHKNYCKKLLSAINFPNFFNVNFKEEQMIFTVAKV